MIAQVCDRESSRDSWFENRLVEIFRFEFWPLEKMVILKLVKKVGIPIFFISKLVKKMEFPFLYTKNDQKFWEFPCLLYPCNQSA